MSLITAQGQRPWDKFINFEVTVGHPREISYVIYIINDVTRTLDIHVNDKLKGGYLNFEERYSKNENRH